MPGKAGRVSVRGFPVGDDAVLPQELFRQSGDLRLLKFTEGMHGPLVADIS